MRFSQRISIALFLPVCLAAAMVFAQQGGGIDAHSEAIRRANQRLAEIEKLVGANSGELMNSEVGRKLVRSKIDAQRAKARALDGEIISVTSRIERDSYELRGLERTVAKLRADYGGMVRAAWKDHKLNTSTAFLLSSGDFNDATRRISYIRRYNRARAAKGAEIDSLGRVLQAGIGELEIRKAGLEGLKSESNALIASLAADEIKYETTLATLRRNRGELEKAAQKERDNIAAAELEISRIMAEQARLEKQRTDSEGFSEAELALSGRFEDNKGRLPWPVGSPATVVGHFGIERLADGIQKEFLGTIIAAPRGAPVKAVFEGKVTVFGDLKQFGKCVMVRSGNYVVGYANLVDTPLKTGDEVSIGQVIGTLPDSADASRCILLLQMAQGMTPLDPEQWLRR